MDEQIITRETIIARAEAAFVRGAGRNSHNMNWHAAALPVWLAAYDRMAATPPRSHIAAPGLQRFDLRQECAA